MLDAPAVVLETVVVTATRAEARAFDVPAAIGAVDAGTIAAAGPQVNLSEALARIPGITALNRQNYSQDLQLSIRGFGSRSTFGIRGVRLIVDGIPATMPDGQGQASNVSLASASRVEVLRGPLALLYGNAAGGVVQVITEAGATQPTASLSASRGSFDASRVGAGFAATSGALRYAFDASRFETDGYRDHGAAQRDQLNAKFSWQAAAATRVDVVANVLDQPLALDPLGLTRAQWEANPRQSPAVAFAQDASKTVRQQQAGVVLDHGIDSDTTLTARAYLGARSLDNKLSIPLAAQLAPTSSGGIVSFDRDYQGAAVQLSRRIVLSDQLAARVVAGVEHDRMRDDRQGYLNNAGVRGELRRDEDDRVANTDAFFQATLDAAAWSAIAGVRASRVAFETKDRYVAPGNPDDGGAFDYRAANPVAGLTWHASPSLNVYANAGRGFETPTFTEIAYRNNASGLNSSLSASKSTHAEVGAKWRAADHLLDVAAFDIGTRDEIVVDTNVGGRSTFRNAGRTTRRGFEAGYAGQWWPQVRVSAALTVLDARFENGNRLPGTPPRSAFLEAAWRPGLFEAAMEVVHVGRLYVNDANEDFAPAATTLNLRAAARLAWGALEIRPLLRLENATDRKYAGSVIVNEANRRFFEPAPSRNWLAAVTVRYRF
ncbi:MAG TPA: TonB-dependent receptor [Usitatibacter sp.]|nr:TonB-dependent receptor [Usitatibacter sp.]